MGGLERRTGLFQTLTPGAAQGQAGLSAGPSWASIGNLILTSQTLYVVRFAPEEATPITKISYLPTAADAANPNVDVGIGTLVGTTFTPLASSGSVAGGLNATSLVTQTLTTPYVPTVGTPLYAAFVTAASGTPATIQGVTTNAAVLWSVFGSTGPSIYAMAKAAVGVPIGTSAITTLVSTANIIPFLVVRTD